MKNIMQNDFDVVVVGARCAGATTALLLARAGARVLVIDRGAYGTDTLSTHALMRGAVMQLHRWKVLPRIQRSGTPPVRTTTFGYRTGRVTVDIEPRHGVDALYAPRRTVLDRALVDEATLAGVEFSYRTTVTALIARDDRVTGVHARTQHGERAITCDLVVGADGLHSTVSQLVGAEQRVVGRHRTANLYSYWEGVEVSGYEWLYHTRASTGVIPTNDGAVCVFLSVPSDDFDDATQPNATSGYERLLRQHAPDLADRLQSGRRVTPVRGFPGHVGYLKESVGPGWALVGDAGYFKDPLTAHGITDALRDAELLARAAAVGTSAAFAEYEYTRNDLSLRLFEITDQIASFDWTDDEAQALHRAFSREMSREQKVLSQLEPTSWLSPSVSVPHAV